MKHFLVALVILLAPLSPAGAAQDSARLAEVLFDRTVAVQLEPIVDRIILGISREKPLPPEVARIYRESFLEFARSPRYKQAYVDAYTRSFTPAELKVLIDLANHPGFRLYMNKSSSIMEQTYPTFVSLLNESKPQVQRKLEAAGYGAWK